jgi:hypothetical protein
VFRLSRSQIHLALGGLSVVFLALLLLFITAFGFAFLLLFPF